MQVQNSEAEFAFRMREIFMDGTFSEQDIAIFRCFYEAAARRVNLMFESSLHRFFIISTINGDECETRVLGLSTLGSLFDDVLTDINTPKRSLQKGQYALKNALFVCILGLLKLNLVDEELKYPSIEVFLRSHIYRGRYDSESESEKKILFQTANWVNILFKLVRSNGNSDFAITVVPRLLEGWRGFSHIQLFM